MLNNHTHFQGSCLGARTENKPRDTILYISLNKETNSVSLSFLSTEGSLCFLSLYMHFYFIIIIAAHKVIQELSHCLSSQVHALTSQPLQLSPPKLWFRVQLIHASFDVTVLICFDMRKCNYNIVSLSFQGNRSCESYYRHALELKPDYILAWANLGLVLLNTGEVTMLK